MICSANFFLPTVIGQRFVVVCCVYHSSPRCVVVPFLHFPFPRASSLLPDSVTMVLNPRVLRSLRAVFNRVPAFPPLEFVDQKYSVKLLSFAFLFRFVLRRRYLNRSLYVLPLACQKSLREDFPSLHNLPFLAHFCSRLIAPPVVAAYG